MQTFESNKTNSLQKVNSEPEQSFFAPSLLFQQEGVGKVNTEGGNAHKPSFFPARPQPVIQQKLTINEPGDQFEQEADALAERVIQMNAPPPAEEGRMQTRPLPIPVVHRKCAVSAEENKAQRQEMEVEGAPQAITLMRKVAGSDQTASTQLQSQLNNTKDSGSLLPGQTLDSMNQAFGADFAQVRIHTDSQAAEMSQEIQARAFTHGSDIYFNRGQYNPESSEGKRLLGHELVHVVQQGGNTGLINRAPAGQSQGNSTSPATNYSINPSQKVADLLSYLPHISWIDGLVQNDLRDQIDQEFAVSKETVMANKFIKDFIQYSQLQIDLSQADDKRRKAIEEKIRRLEQSMGTKLQTLQGARPIKKGESIIIPDTASPVSWDIGRLIARMNFMGMMVPLLGSIDKVKTHFSGVREVSFNKNLFLSKDAAGRLEKAKIAFEDRTNFKFPRSTVGQSLRGRHQTRQSKGMLGHPLGFSIDYFAYENPHLKESRFFIEEITGRKAILEFFDAENQPLSYNDRRSMILKIGKETVAGTSRSESSDLLLGQIEQAHAAFAATSKAIQDSLSPMAKERLQELAVQEYWSKNLPAQKSLQKLEKQLKQARAKAVRNLRTELKTTYKTNLQELESEKRQQDKAYRESVKQLKKERDRKITDQEINSNLLMIDLLAQQEQLKLSEGSASEIRKTKREIDKTKRSIIRDIKAQRKSEFQAKLQELDDQKKSDRTTYSTSKSELKQQRDREILSDEVDEFILSQQDTADAVLLQDYQEQKRAFEESSANLKRELETLFQPYFEILGQRKSDALAEFSDVNFSELPTQKELDQIARQINKIKLGKVTTRNKERKEADMRIKLLAIQEKYPKAFPATPPPIPDESATPSQPDSLQGSMETVDVSQLKSEMLSRISYLQEATKSQTYHGWIEQLEGRLINDFAFVFGEPKYAQDSSPSLDLTVDNPSVLQILQKGIIRDDSTSGETGFNVEFFKVMIEHGFDPGATWNAVDTMHFDFVEGFASLKAGMGSFGPEGFSELTPAKYQTQRRKE